MVALVLVMVLAAANAGVPSISTNDTTQIKDMKASASETIDQGFILNVVEPPKVVQNEIQSFYQYVNNETGTKAPIGYFPEAVQQAVQEKLPEDIAEDTLQVNEMISLQTYNYDTKYGDVTVEIAFATVYQEGSTVVVLVGLSDADGNIEYVVVDAYVTPSGSLMVVFPQELLLRMEKAAAIPLVVFNEP